MPESPLLFSSLVPTCGFCLQVQSRSRGVQKQGQVGRWADRCRGFGHQLPTASGGPQAGRWRRAPQRLDSSTCRLQNRRNKARMSMKTNSREVEKSRSRGVVKPDQQVRRGDAYGLSLFDFQLSTLNCFTRIRRNKARMSMKTKEEVKKSSGQAQSPALTHPSPGSLLSPPSPISGVRWTPSGSRNRTPQRRGTLVSSFSVYKNRGNEPTEVLENKGRRMLQSAKTNSK
jgi:hypothetical protein